MSDIYSDSVYVQIKLLCKKRFPSPLRKSSSVLTYALSVGRFIIIIIIIIIFFFFLCVCVTIGVGAQSTLGGRHLCPKKMYEKITKCQNDI